MRRRATKVDARTISAIIIPSILSPWLACRLNPEMGGPPAGGPDMLDGADMAGLLR